MSRASSSSSLQAAALQQSGSTRAMASTKAVKVAGAAAQAKEPAPKLSETATKPSAAKSGVKKAEQKPREPKKKVGKPASASLLLPLPVLFLFVTTYVLRVKPGEEQQAGGSQKVTMEAKRSTGACARGPPSCYYKFSLYLLLS